MTTQVVDKENGLIFRYRQVTCSTLGMFHENQNLKFYNLCVGQNRKKKAIRMKEDFMDEKLVRMVSLHINRLAQSSWDEGRQSLPEDGSIRIILY